MAHQPPVLWEMDQKQNAAAVEKHPTLQLLCRSIRPPLTDPSQMQQYNK
jgi:hypothetical protein